MLTPWRHPVTPGSGVTIKTDTREVTGCVAAGGLMVVVLSLVLEISQQQ